MTAQELEECDRIMERNQKMIEDLAQAFSWKYGFEIRVDDIGALSLYAMGG